MEDAIRAGKDCGIGTYPSTSLAMNKAKQAAVLTTASIQLPSTGRGRENGCSVVTRLCARRENRIPARAYLGASEASGSICGPW